LFKIQRALTTDDRIILMFDSGRPWRLELDDDASGRPFLWLTEEIPFDGDHLKAFAASHAFVVARRYNGLEAEIYLMTTDRSGVHEIARWASPPPPALTPPRHYQIGRDSTFYVWYRLRYPAEGGRFGNG
jgi:hypothetical protein